jgi:disulfide bond formation protein DsbB
MINDKQPLIDLLNHYLSIATVIGLVFVILWVLGIVASSYFKKECKISKFFSKYALQFGFFVSLIGTFITLYYSDYLGILPCGLCWFQRVFLYSQLFIFGLAWYKNDRKIFDYTLLLSIVGFIVATYQSYLQLGYSELLPCPVVASTIDCAKPTFIEYGFVTFPFMAVVLFAFLIILSVTANRSNK